MPSYGKPCPNFKGLFEVVGIIIVNLHSTSVIEFARIACSRSSSSAIFPSLVRIVRLMVRIMVRLMVRIIVRIRARIIMRIMVRIMFRVIMRIMVRIVRLMVRIMVRIMFRII